MHRNGGRLNVVSVMLCNIMHRCAGHWLRVKNIMFVLIRPVTTAYLI